MSRDGDLPALSFFFPLSLFFILSEIHSTENNYVPFVFYSNEVVIFLRTVLGEEERQQKWIPLYFSEN